METYIRWMIRRDMPRVLKIERECFEDFWTDDDFTRILRQRNHIGMVVELRDVVTGYMIYALHKRSIEVLNFAVAQAVHRHGIGRQMADKLKSKVLLQQQSKIVALVRESNLPAQQFFKAVEFRCVGIKRDHYGTCSEDAYEFVYRIQPDDSEIPSQNRTAKLIGV